jgi:hypothetical protein
LDLPIGNKTILLEQFSANGTKVKDVYSGKNLKLLMEKFLLIQNLELFVGKN